MPLSTNQIGPLQRVKFAEARINKGMITNIDPADIDGGALIQASNARVRFDKTFRRVGYTQVGGSGVNRANDPVTGIFQFKRDDQTRFLVVVHASGYVESENNGTWTLHTGNLLTSATGLYEGVVVNNRVVMATDGQSKLQELFTGAGTVTADLAALAPKARFITGAFNRVVAANNPSDGGGSTIKVLWSGDGAIDHWDPTIDETAGSGLLQDSPADLGDPIMGVLGLDNILFVPRQYSLWIATKTPVPTNPFNFMSLFNGIGTDAPYSVARVPMGAAFADSRSGSVYFFRFGLPPQPIGQLVEKDLFRGLNDPSKIQGTYNASTKEYSMLVPTGQDYSQIWVYNFLTQAWTYDEVYQVTYLTDYQYAYNNTTVDQLVGTADSQIGTADTLGAPATITKENRLYGKKDGAVYIEDSLNMTDAGAAITTKVVTKDFELDETNMYAAEFRIEVQAFQAGALTLYYSRDGGTNWVLAKTWQLVLGKATMLRYVRNIKARRIRWMIQSTDTSIFDLLSYQFYVYASGDSRTTPDPNTGGGV